MMIKTQVALRAFVLALLLILVLSANLPPYSADGNWNIASTGLQYYFEDVWGSSSSDVFVVGRENSGIILHYDGNEWQAVNTDATTYLYGVWGSSPSDVVTVGGGGTILHYNGDTWNEMESGTQEHLRGIWGTSRDDVFAVGDRGTILHYNGSAWNEMESGSQEYLHSIWGSSSSDIFAVGGHYKTGAVILHYNGSEWVGASALQRPFTKFGASLPVKFSPAAPEGPYSTIITILGVKWTAEPTRVYMVCGVHPQMTFSP